MRALLCQGPSSVPIGKPSQGMVSVTLILPASNGSQERPGCRDLRASPEPCPLGAFGLTSPAVFTAHIFLAFSSSTLLFCVFQKCPTWILWATLDEELTWATLNPRYPSHRFGVLREQIHFKIFILCALVSFCCEC